jgi:hypothetical protein
MKRNLRHYLPIIWIAPILLVLFSSQATPVRGSDPAAQPLPPKPDVQGPFVSQPIQAAEYNGDLRSLPHSAPQVAPAEPLKYLPGQSPKGSAPQTLLWTDPKAQLLPGEGQMPETINSFAGLAFQSWGSGWPPDTNGDVGPNYYIQAVNTSIGIFDIHTGDLITATTYDDLFSNAPASTPCYGNNQGDVIVLYDALVKRWLVSDFGFPRNSNNGPYYECIAISKTSDPLSGGWYLYAMPVSSGPSDPFNGYMNDYPKLGVWRDGWYMSANMYRGVDSQFGGVRVWALDRASMIAGTLRVVHFDCTSSSCASLLPANLRGALPPAGSPEYFAAVDIPNILNLWKFHVNWTSPASSTFTGPTQLLVADFVIAPSIPQPGSFSRLLDSLSYRLMMQLQYRNFGSHEALWVNHSVANQGNVGVRWYEVRDPGGVPTLAQQGTYQPDSSYRWMGSLAIDRDGNMALGYSVSSSSIYPSIRYSGRLNGEFPGMLPQAETTLMQGSGSQTNTTRWGDYSAMTIDPQDDCTFWYTNEYYLNSGPNWQTRIGSFKFPSCGQPKAHIVGTVRNAVTLQPITDVTVTARSITQTLTVAADSSGFYTTTLLSGSYTLTAGPLPPGYPFSNTVSGISASTGITPEQDIFLTPQPYLTGHGYQVSDPLPYGNNDGFPEPGESHISLWAGLQNVGAITSTHISASLTSLTSGLLIQDSHAQYPDIAAGQVQTNTIPFSFSVSPTLACGSELKFLQTITDSSSVYTQSLTLNASLPLPRRDVISNTVEFSQTGWTTGGSNNTWGITNLQYHSPTHSWTDSPNGDYANNANSYLRSPTFDLTGKRNIQFSGWFKYALEPGYDYVYLNYSLDGGVTWSKDDLSPLIFSGNQPDWQKRTVSLPALDNQKRAAFRFHLVTDTSVTADGIYIDDIALSYEPYTCPYIYLPTTQK